MVRRIVQEQDLKARIVNVYEEAGNAAQSESRRDHLLARRDEAVERLSGADVPVAGFNHYLKIAVSGDAQRRMLTERLASEPGGLPEGFWTAAYLKFESVKESGTLAELVDNDGAVQRVRDTWSVIQGLAAADASRVGLLLFYFVTGEQSVSNCQELWMTR